MFKTYKQRRDALHLVREAVRGAATKAGTRIKTGFMLNSYGALTMVAIGVFNQNLIPFLFKVNFCILSGLTGYCAVNGLAMAAHRVLNKRIPEAPNRNRIAQKWGHRAVGVVATSAMLAASTGALYLLNKEPNRPARTFNNESGSSYQRIPYQSPPNHHRLPAPTQT